MVIEATDFAADPKPHILISGLGTFGRAILVEYSRHWRLRSPWREHRPTVTVIDLNAGDGVDDIIAQWPFVRDVCDVTPFDGEVNQALKVGLSPPPTTAYICDEDEAMAIRTALSAASLWRGGPRSLVVRLNVMARLGSAFHGSDGRNGGDSKRAQAKLLDDLGGRLVLVGLTEMASDTVTVVQQDLVERLAQVIHEQYLLTQLRAGQVLGSKPALQLWPSLTEDLKNANRAQAGDIGTKLSEIQCTVAPHGGDETPFRFTEAEVALLAEREHERWFADRYSSGWRYAAQRDDDKKLNPAMMRWHDLTASERDKNRNAIRALPIVLADVGLRIVRLTRAEPDTVPHQRGPHRQPTVACVNIQDTFVEQWARSIHQRYVAKWPSWAV